MATVLKGMTWDHPRGYAPLSACSTLWRQRRGVEIRWDRRSLQDFESYPVEELARAYDLIVIDHPHVGQITREQCLAPFDPASVEDIRAGSTGASFDSYRWRGEQWALPLDAATQVQAWRPDRLPAAPASWAQVLELAREGRVALPMRPPHSLMCVYTLVAQLGAPANVEGPQLFDPDAGASAIELLRELMQHVDPVAYGQDPIAVYEDMAKADGTIDCAPLIYGYVNYAYDGFRPARLGFADMPTLGESGPVGSALGGTGIAVSAFSAARDEAQAFARWVASADVQRGVFAAAGGQPAHAAAWDDDVVNAITNGFYRSTRATVNHAWVRPRHDGYMAFQHAAAVRVVEGLRGRESASAVTADLNALFRASLTAT